MNEIDSVARLIGILCWLIAGVFAYFVFNFTFWQSVAIGLLVGYMAGLGIAILSLLLRIAQHIGMNND